jgi:hypothetical protein
MKTAQELLHDLRTTKRASCMSEYTTWINDVVEYLTAQVPFKGIVIDPTIADQMDLFLDIPPSIKDGFEGPDS